MHEEKIRTIVLGIFLHNDRLLVFRGEDPERDVVFYRPLGGGIEFGERGCDALVREMREELGAEVTDVRYLGTLESIFTHRGKRGHEIALLYRARFTDPALYERETFEYAQDNGTPIAVSWKPIADFETGAFLVPRELLAIVRDEMAADRFAAVR